MSPKVIEEPIGIDIPRAVALSSLSKSTIRAHIRSGRLRAVKIGRRVIIPLEELRRFLALPSKSHIKILPKNFDPQSATQQRMKR